MRISDWSSDVCSSDLLMGARMADRIILVIAWDGVQPVAGAMHLLGADKLYGRYWGWVADIPYLHFAPCYSRAIDIAITRGLASVQAWAQGGTKRLGRPRLGEEGVR